MEITGRFIGYEFDGDELTAFSPTFSGELTGFATTFAPPALNTVQELAATQRTRRTTSITICELR